MLLGSGHEDQIGIKFCLGGAASIVVQEMEEKFKAVTYPKPRVSL